MLWNTVGGITSPQTPPMLEEASRRIYVPIVRLRIGDNRYNSLHLLSGFGNIVETTTISRHWHRARNKYQRSCMPPNQYIMEALRRMKLFDWYDTTLTHNFKIDYTIDLFRSIEFVKQGGENLIKKLTELLTQREQDITPGNQDYRGFPSTIFEGMQFIYKQPSEMTIKDFQRIDDVILAENINAPDTSSDIVLEQKNIGTFDYVSPYRNESLHGAYDVIPWLLWGNEMESDDLLDEKVVMSQDVLEQVKCAATMYLTEKMDLQTARAKIETAVRSVLVAPPHINSLRGITQ